MKRLAALAFSAAAVAAFADVPGWSVVVTPSKADSLEPVYARVATNRTCLLEMTRTQLRQEGSVIIVTVHDVGPSCVPFGRNEFQDLSLGQFHPGRFSVVVRDAGGLQLTSAEFEVVESASDRVRAFVDYTDLWWNPQESGWGLGITHHASGQLFGTWYTYEPNGEPSWFTLQPGEWTSPTQWTGPIYKTRGPFFGAPFEASRFSVMAVGKATLAFDGPSSGTFSYTLEGVSSSRRIERMVF